MAGNDKVIGKLTLDTTDIDKKIKDINTKLAGLGAGVKVDLSKQVAGEVKKQLKAIEDEIDKSLKAIQASAKKAVDTFSNAASSSGKSGLGTLKSEIVDTESVVRTLGRTVNSAGQTIESIVSETKTGYNSLGEKIREVTDSHGNLVKKIKDVGTEYKTALRTFVEFQSKLAQLNSMDMTGKTDTASYARLYSQVEVLAKEWASVEPKVKSVVLATDEAKQAAQLYANTISTINAGLSDKSAEQALKNQISLYEQWYKYLSQASTYAQKGDSTNANMYQALADGIKSYIDAVASAAPALDAQAQAEQRVVQAHLNYETTLNSNATKEQTEGIERYKTALLDLLKAQTDLNNQVASGKITEGSEKYKESEENINRLQTAAVDAGQKIDAAGRQTAESTREVSNAFAQLKASEAGLIDSQTPSYLQQVTDAYNNLKNAINQYGIAKKANNEQGMSVWQDEINKQSGIISGIEQIVGTLNVEESEREQIRVKIEQAKTLQDGFNKGVVGGANATGELESQISGVLTRMFSLVAVIRTINNLISSAVEYVSEYSNKMNEIQMITLKTDQEVAQLGETYRDIAEMMNVSSLDMADAAIYFTRQGLGAEEIEKRLKNVTMYAKAANVEFNDASEIITAVVNSMGLVEQEAEDGRNAAQRVADVFLTVGDNAATSGQEIGEAMQKAAASAGAFGMDFEWLASYIATVSETTRQEARTIGTAFNTIIARLHQIKQTGYNSEDETKINDIQKALANIGVTLMDQNNEWRDMDVIFQEIASQWDTLDGKTKSYIATTMAGVKQQNVFLALMNDLGKHNSENAEEGSRAWELYGKAIESAGVAEQKYSVYRDSVAASQERLNIAQEKFYSLLDDDVIKNWNNSLAGFINMINDGTEAMNGWNIAIPAIAAAITGLILVIKNFSAVTSTLMAHPVIAIIGAVSIAVVGLTTVISGLAAELGSTKKRFDEANQALSESRDRMSELTAANTQVGNLFSDLQEGAELTAEDLQKYSTQLDQIAKLSPTTKEVVEQLRAGFIDQKDAVEQLTDEINRLIETENKYSQIQLLKKYSNWTPDDTDSDSMLHYMQTDWVDYTLSLPTSTSNMSDAEKFANNLKWNWQSSNGMPEAVKNLINETRKNLKSAGMTEDEQWGIIGQIVWQEFVGNDTYSLQDALKSKAESIINEAVDTLSAGLDNTEVIALRQQLTDLLLGEDGKMDEREYQDIGKKMAQYISGVLKDGISFSDVEIGEALGEQLFGSATEGVFEDMGGEFSKAFIGGYQDAIAAGFKDSDIVEIFKESGLPTMELDRIGDIIHEKLLQSISDAMGSDDIMSLLNWNPMWEDVDLTTLKVVNDFIRLGIEVDQIDELLANSNSPEEFAEALKHLGEEAGVSSEELEEEAVSITDLVKSIKSARSEYNSLEKLQNTIIKNGKVEFSDVIDFAETHPELLTLIDDTDKLMQRIEELKQMDIDSIVESVKKIMLNSPEEAGKSPWAEQIREAGLTTHQEYRNLLEESGEDFSQIDNYVNQTAESIKQAAQKTEDAAETWLEAQAKIAKTTGEVNWAKSNNFVEQIGELQRALESGGESAALNVWNQYTEEMKKAIADQYPQLIQALADTEAGLKNEATFMDKASEATARHNEELKELQNTLYTTSNTDLNNRPIVSQDQMHAAGWDTDEDISTVYSNDYWAGGQGIKWDQNVIVSVTPILENGEVMTQESLNAYMDELFANSSDLDELMENDKKHLILNVEAVSDNESFETAQERVENLMVQLSKIQAELYGTSSSMKNTSKSAKNLATELSNASKSASVKSFEKTNEAIQKLRNGTISATDAYDTFVSEVDKVKKAEEEIISATDKVNDGTELTVSDINDLASVLGMTTDQVLNDFPGAVDMFNELIAEGGELEETFNALNEAAFIRITGTSEADFSAIQDGLISVQGMAQETIDLLIATGQWTLETMKLNTEAWVQQEDGSWAKQLLTGYQQILKPTGNNPFKGKSNDTSSSKKSSGSSKKSSGGGGSSSSSDSDSDTDTSSSSSSDTMTEVEKILDMMEKIQDIMEYQQSYYQSQRSYYSTTGQLQGVIGYAEKEKELLEEQNEVLQSNVDTIETYIEAKKEELSLLDTSDEAYEEVADDLDKLQDEHQEYTQQIIDNKTAIEELNDTIKDQKDAIRDMQIDIRNLIYQAIEDREAKITSMLENEIDMENEIFDIIKERYELERDKMLDATEDRIDALRTERDLLSEQLSLRKAMDDKVDKAAKLTQLEEQYQRILADPTRRKEAMALDEKIGELRQEIAYQAAEDEINAQQESLDQQIDSLDEYKEYIEEFYEDLFEHPQELIDEMREVLSQTDEEIIDWLKRNDSTYAASSENTQKSMVNAWQQTLDDMRGKINTYWAEVEEIVAKGDDAIIEFLKENSADYAKAGELQAEKYVDSWKEQLESLKKALEEVETQAANTYIAIPESTYDGSSSSDNDTSSSSGSGGGSGSSKKKTTEEEKRYGFTTTDTRGYPKSEGGTVYAKNETEARSKAASAIKSFWSDRILDYVYQYAKGGLASNTGLAWLDGTQQDPERVLSPYQTKLFESMVKALESISMISVPSMPNYGDITTGSESSVSVGDIIVNVDNLDTDDDYETLADKVSEVLMERIGMTTVVGGLRINPI